MVTQRMHRLSKRPWKKAGLRQKKKKPFYQSNGGYMEARAGPQGLFYFV